MIASLQSRSISLSATIVSDSADTVVLVTLPVVPPPRSHCQTGTSLALSSCTDREALRCTSWWSCGERDCVFPVEQSDCPLAIALRPEGPRFSALGRSKYIVELWDGSVRDMAKPVTRTSAESAVVPPGVSEDIPVIVAAKSSVPKSVLEALQMIDMPDEEDDISGEPVTNPAACGPAGRPATTTLDSLLQSAASVGTALTRVQAKLRSTESTLERNALLSIAAHCVQTQCSLAWLMAELTDREE